MTDNPRPGRRTIAPEDARQGEIVLRERRRRIVFVAGLIGIVVVALLGTVAAYGSEGDPAHGAGVIGLHGEEPHER